MVKHVYTTILCIFSDVNSFILQGSDSWYFDKPNMEPDLKQILYYILYILYSYIHVSGLGIAIDHVVMKLKT